MFTIIYNRPSINVIHYVCNVHVIVAQCDRRRIVDTPSCPRGCLNHSGLLLFHFCVFTSGFGYCNLPQLCIIHTPTLGLKIREKTRFEFIMRTKTFESLRKFLIMNFTLINYVFLHKFF